MSIDPNFNMPEKKIYAGPDAAEHMLDELTKDTDDIFKQYIQTPKPMLTLMKISKNSRMLQNVIYVVGNSPRQKVVKRLKIIATF